MESTWFEVWWDAAELPYLLLVTCSGSGTFRVIDPRENNRVVYDAPDYEAIKRWLEEDEYERVEGRTDTPSYDWLAC